MSSLITAQPPRWAILFDMSPTSHWLEGYLFVGILGRGGNSTGVMLVRHMETGKLYARKYINSSDEQNPNMWASEFEFGYDLTYSGFTANVHSRWPTTDGAQYRTIVTEYCDGGSAQDWFDKHATPRSREYMAWLVIVEATRGMAYLHSDQATSQGAIWHGDAHLANIFLHFGGQAIPKLVWADFGLSVPQSDAQRAIDDGFCMADELGYIDWLKHHINREANPSVADELRQIIASYPELLGITSAQELLYMVEAVANERMEYLRSLPGFSIPRPAVSDVPYLFASPQITGEHAGVLNKIPRNEEGEPTWRWVKMDLTDKTYRSFWTPDQDGEDVYYSSE
jgi:serine/threonine protein kinase